MIRRRETFQVAIGAALATLLKPRRSSAAEVINRHSTRLPVTSITVISNTTVPGLEPLLAKICKAVDEQLRLHVGPLWRIIPPRVSYSADGSVPEGSTPLIVTDESEHVNALGYHTEANDGQPFGVVMAKTVMDNGGTLITGPNSVSSVLSHEVLEIVGDPAVNLWAAAPTGFEYAVELCDPVEGDSYELLGVHVSNFVLPSWFDALARPDARFDFLDYLRAPYTMTRNGYLIRAKGDKVELVFGASFPEWKKDVKRRARAARR